MRVLVFGHHLELGGSQFNSIELAATLERQHGHEVTIFAAPGPALDLVTDHRLRYVAAPRARRHPSPVVMRALRRTVREERIELVHAWEWAQCLEAFYALQVAGRTPVVGSDMSMAVTRFLPRCLPITYGTPELVDQARDWHTGPVELLEPPVDVDANRPGAVDSRPFRQAHGLDGEDLNVVIVSRLVGWLKLEGLERSIDAVAGLTGSPSVKLVIVGGGPEFGRLSARASAVNARLGRDAVVLTGPLTDPRPAYAAADLVMGMGSSLLRGLAFAKPCIVLGEAGFSLPFTPATSRQFLRHGFYGLGTGTLSPAPLEEQLAAMTAEPDRLPELGAYGRRLVEERFSLQAGAAKLDAMYRSVAARQTPYGRAAAEGLRSGLHRAATLSLPAGLRRQILRSRFFRPAH